MPSEMDLRVGRAYYRKYVAKIDRVWQNVRAFAAGLRTGVPTMHIDIVTVFPEMIACALDHSIIKRATERGLVTIQTVNLRDFTEDKHRTTDDTPYGGGGGMVMKVDPIARAVDYLICPGRFPEIASTPSPEGLARACSVQEALDPTSVAASGDASRALLGGSDGRAPSPRIVLTDPRGPVFTQEIARIWAKEPHIILLCGHYEGVDERVRQNVVTDEISIGDYILTGGELPALVVVDALTRLQPGALGDADAPDNDTFAANLLEYPQYTRPNVFQGWETPGILLSGHRAMIERWRRWHQLQATRARRPDLFARLELSPQDLKLLDSEEPEAPPDKKLAMRSARASAPPDRAGTETDQRREETSDGTGTRNDT